MARQSSTGFPDTIDWSETDLTVKTLETPDASITTLNTGTANIDVLNLGDLPNVVTPTGTRLKFNNTYHLASGGTFSVDSSEEMLPGTVMTLTFSGTVTLTFFHVLNSAVVYDLDPSVGMVSLDNNSITLRRTNTDQQVTAIVKIHATSLPSSNAFTVERFSRVEYVTE